MVILGNDGKIVTHGRIVSFDPGSDMLAAASSGATVATGPVKLVKLANGPSGPFMPRPKESRDDFRPFGSEQATVTVGSLFPTNLALGW